MGHIRSTTCSEAAALGMDFIEHSFGFCDEVRLPNGDITRDPDAPPASRLIRRSAVPFALEYPGRAAQREATEASSCSSQPAATRMAEPVLFRRHAAILDASGPGSHRIGVPLQSRARNRGRRVIYATSDAEWFWTRTNPAERFANKQRIRAGLGRRWSYAWRTEVMAIWDRSRDSADHGFATADVAIDLRLRRVW